LTCSGQLTHVSGHPLAAGQAQDRESPPAKDRHSTTEPTPPTNNLVFWWLVSAGPRCTLECELNTTCEPEQEQLGLDSLGDW